MRGIEKKYHSKERITKICNNLRYQDILTLAKHYAEEEVSIDESSKIIAMQNLVNIIHQNMKTKSIHKSIREAHYYTVDYFCSEGVRKSVLSDESISAQRNMCSTVNILMINEYFLYRKRQCLLTIDSLDILDSYITHYIKTENEISTIIILHPIIKSMQLRSRKFRVPYFDEQAATQFFENKLSFEECIAMNEYELAQLCLNISFVDMKYYNLLFTLKKAIIDKLQNNLSNFNIKNLCQIISCVYRLELVLHTNIDDIKILNKSVRHRLDEMNVLDIQSLLSGVSFIYERYVADLDLVTSMLDRIVEKNFPLNSLILTNLMKSLVKLNVKHDKFYEYIVDCIKSDYYKYDNVALSYTFARLIRLAQFDKAQELLGFFSDDIDFFNKVENAHNKCQILLGLATLKNYDIEVWSTLLESFKNHNFYNDKHSNSPHFVKSCILFFELAKIEAPELYDELISGTDLEKFVKNYNIFIEENTEVSQSQAEIVRYLENMGYNVKNEFKINGKSFDIYIPEINTVIEYNGPTHYLQGTDIKIGSSIYNERLVNNKLNYVEIPYYDIDKIRNLDDSSLFSNKRSRNTKKEFETIEDYLRTKLPEK